MKRLNLGNSDFKNVILDNSYYIDKSLFIEEIIDIQAQVLLIPRPRRFGKTLNLSMLRYFFDLNEDNNEDLFKDLIIWEKDNQIKKHCGQYPVIHLSFKDAKGNSWKETFLHIQNEIINTFTKHDYLLESKLLKSYEKDYISEILRKKTEQTEYSFSIKQLSNFLWKHHKKKIVILIDEYDTPIQSGYQMYYNEVVSFMKSLLSGAFKDNSNLYKGIITGILRVSRESIFSGLNNISVHTILDSEFADKFGFTKNEVKQILSDFDIKTPYYQIKEWYDGYTIGNVKELYNPWSILNFAIAKEKIFKPYWANTSTNELIKQEIQKKNSQNIREDLIKIMNGNVLTQQIESNFVFPDLERRNNLIWTLLTFSGYLTIREKLTFEKFKIAIPNYELSIVFKKTILEWLEGDINLKGNSVEETALALVNNELTAFEKGFKKIIGDTFSYFDTAKNHEYVYHSYLLGLLAILGNKYRIKSNRESGEGRYDIMMIPRKSSTSPEKPEHKNGVVIEIKQIEGRTSHESETEFKQRINNAIDDAAEQIVLMNYEKELIDNEVEKRIKVPVCFAGKEAFVTKFDV